MLRDLPHVLRGRAGTEHVRDLSYLSHVREQIRYAARIVRRARRSTPPGEDRRETAAVDDTDRVAQEYE
jgi:hypothetical protein